MLVEIYSIIGMNIFGFHSYSVVLEGSNFIQYLSSVGVGISLCMALGFTDF